MSENFNPYEEKIQYHTVGDGKTLKVGIISDSQIIPSDKECDRYLKLFSYHLKNTLEVLKSHKIQALIFAGDLVDSGTEYAYKEIVSIFNEVYKTEEEKPIFNFIMGNHDYWLSYMEMENIQKSMENRKKCNFYFIIILKKNHFHIK